MAGPSDKGFADFDARLQALRGRRVDGTADAPVEPAAKGGAGLQAGIELVVGVAVGGGVGYGLDRWLETWPALFITLFFLGAAAGMLNAYRHIRRASKPHGDKS